MKASDRRTGYKQPCKVCDSARSRQYTLQRFVHDEQGRAAWNHARGIRYRAAHPLRVQQANMRWRMMHHDAIRTYRQQYLSQHPEKRELYLARARRGSNRYRMLHKTALALKRQQYARTHRAEENARLRAYYKKFPERLQAKRSREYARKTHTLHIEDVSLDVLYARDRGICQLCYTRCLRTEATRDHIIPISQQGETSYRNIVLAHRRCNSRKRNTLVIQQMRLF
jgi:5-methylcytosine-specific restriction endonuclease McrA